jgi:tetratricopeptide (TPR) repeat protein
VDPGGLEPAHALPDVPEGAPLDTRFDWGALLGRDVEPPAPVADFAPIDQGIGVYAPAAAVDTGDAAAHQARSVVDVQDDLELEEVDLTDLLDQLALERPLSYPPPRVLEGSADARPGADVREDSDAGVLAARHLAAGRVFAAAGLVAEAARAFERASRDLRTRFEAAEALAGLHRSRGQMTEALRWYDEAARAPVADESVRRPVLYDLAEALEAAGQPGRALAVLLDLLSEVEDYRDARARADRLLRVDAGG